MISVKIKIKRIDFHNLCTEKFYVVRVGDAYSRQLRYNKQDNNFYLEGVDFTYTIAQVKVLIESKCWKLIIEKNEKRNTK